MTTLTPRVRQHNWASYRGGLYLMSLLLSVICHGQTLYSRSDGAWGDAGRWSTTEGGGSCACSPSATNDVVIRHSVSLGAGTETTADMTIRDDGALTASGGTLNVQGSMTLSGSLTVSGGTVNVGLTGAATDIDYDQTNVAVVPGITVSSGTLLVYGGINHAAGAGTEPFAFSQSGGTVDLNNGTSLTADEVLGVNNVAGSVFTMSEGIIYVRDESSGAVEFDIGGANVSHNVTGGSVYFGATTGGNRAYEFVPYSGITQPGLRIDCTGTSTLQPSGCGDFTILSLHMAGNDQFDVGGGGACSNTMTVTATYDGTYSIYLANEDNFNPRTGTVHVSGSGTIFAPGHQTNGPFYHLQASDAGQTVTIENTMHINGDLTLGDGAFHVPSGVVFRITGSTSPVSPINKTATTSFTGGGWFRFGFASGAVTYNLAGGDYGEMLIATTGNTDGSTVTVEQQGDISAKIIAAVGDFVGGRPSVWNTNNYTLDLSEHLWVGRGANGTAHTVNLGSSTVNLTRDLWVEGGGVLNMGSATVNVGERLRFREGGGVDGTINAGTSTLSFDGSGDWVVDSNNNLTVNLYNLRLDRAGAVQLTDANLEISNEVTFIEGTIEMVNGGETFTLGASASVAGSAAASFVAGPQRKITASTDPFTFTVGKNGVIRRITITPSTAATTTWEAQYFDTAPPAGTMDGGIQQIMPTEYWDVTRVSGSSGAYFDVSWINWEVQDPSETVVAHFNTSTSTWENLGGTPSGSGQTGTITSTVELTSFSPIALASTSLSNTLPVELIDFSGYSDGGSNVLRWATQTETNNDYFAIERSTDGRSFESIGQVQGAGTYASRLQYEFVDQRPPALSTYYRLKQVDFDGTFEYSPVITVHHTGETSFCVYPNPAPEEVVIRLPLVGEAVVRLLDPTGRLVLEHLATEGSHSLDLSSLGSGRYILKVSTDSWRESTVLIKQ